jgi:hypothetical protein
MKLDHKYVGYWSINDEHGDGIHILKKKRPPWIHRFMNRILFGNKWYDLRRNYN